jgi:hypothetical protein
MNTLLRVKEVCSRLERILVGSAQCLRVVMVRSRVVVIAQHGESEDSTTKRGAI